MGCIHDLPPHVLELSEKYGYFGVDDGFVVDGCFGLSESDKISSIRGTPRVTFDLEEIPAK